MTCVHTIQTTAALGYLDRQAELADIAHEERKDALFDDMANDPQALADIVTGDQLTLEFEHDFCALLSAALKCPGSDTDQLKQFTLINNKATALLKQMAEHIAEREL